MNKKEITGFLILLSLIAGTNTAAQGVTDADRHYLSIEADGNQAGNYNNDGATGENAIAIGKDAKAVKAGNIAIGKGAKTNKYEHSDSTQGEDSIAIGTDAKTFRGNSIAIGKEATTTWESGIAIGDRADSGGTASISIGKNSRSGQWDSVAIGNNAAASSIGSIAIGNNVSSDAMYSFVAGHEASTRGANTSVVIGNEAKAIVGGGGLTNSSYQVSIGAESIAEGSRSTAIGLRSHAYNSSVAIGENNIAGAPAKEKENDPLTFIATDNAVAIGIENRATYVYTTAIGSENVSEGYAGVTLGTENRAIGNFGTAIGSENVSEGYVGTTLGRKNKATGDYSSAIGYGTISSGESSLAFGNGAVSSAENSIAIGKNAKATTNNGIAIGANTRTDGFGTISIGEGAFGNNSIAIGKNSYANGGNNTGSIAIGENAKSKARNSVVIGKGAKSEGVFSSGNIILGADSIIKENIYDAAIIGTGAKVESNRSVAVGASSVAKDRVNRLGYDTFVNGSVDISSKLTNEENEKYEAAKNEYKKAIKQGNELGERLKELQSIPVAQRTDEQKAELLKLNKDIGNNNEIVAERYREVSKFESIWKATAGEVAVGDAEKNITRQITGVAAGTEDTDAVNVAQLKSLDKKTFDRLDGEQLYFGKNAKATNENSIAIGSGSSASAKNSISLGANSKTEVSYNNTTAKYTGVENEDSEYGVVSVGSNSIKRRITNVAGGVELTDAVNVEQLDKVNQALDTKIQANTDKITENSEKIQANTDKIAENSGKIQANTDKIAENSGKIQANTDKIAENSGKIQANTDKIAENSGKIQANTDKITENSGKIQANTDKINSNSDKIENIKNNQSDTNEKVQTNADKIKDNNDKIQANTDKIKDNNSKIQSNADKIKDNSSIIKDLQQSNQNIISQIESNRERISRLNNKLNKGLAASAAMAGIEFLEINENEVTYGVAVGAYEGEQAVAFGLQGAPTENTRVHGKVSVTTGRDPDAMVSVGASWKFNFR